MVTLEAWALGKPVLANARCDVLQGQSRRSRAGLYYGSYEEFRDALRLMLADKDFVGINARSRRPPFPFLAEATATTRLSAVIMSVTSPAIIVRFASCARACRTQVA